MSRWWTYQRERFQLAVNGPLVAVFSLDGFYHSALIGETTTLPGRTEALVEVITPLGFLLLLRSANKFKDAETNGEYRALRPVS